MRSLTSSLSFYYLNMSLCIGVVAYLGGGGGGGAVESVLSVMQRKEVLSTNMTEYNVGG